MTGTALAHVAAGQLPARDTEHETSIAAAAAQAKAATEARYLVAMRQPRNIDQVRVKILQACQRPVFAATARYSKPVSGKSIVGASIRFAEEAARCLGNLLIETPTIYDDPEKRIVRVIVTDLESNLSYTHDITVEKVVERAKVKPGQTVLSTRLNSNGQPVHLVAATEDELLNKQGAQISKQIRNGVLRLLPGDITEEAMLAVAATATNADAADPTAARKRIVDSFFGLGVQPAQLVEYLGHALEQLTPAELDDLRLVYAALRDGETNWTDVMESKGGDAAPARKNGSLKERVAGKPTPEAAPDDRDRADDLRAAKESGDLDA